MKLHAPPNVVKIDTLYVYMSIDENGLHGILADIMPDLGSTPLVTSNPEIAKAMQPMAKRIAARSGKRVGLFTFRREDAPIWEFTP